MKWYAKKLTCPDCKKPVQIMEVAFNSQGGIQVNSICIVCNHDMFWESDIFTIATRCLKADGRWVSEGNMTVN